MASMDGNEFAAWKDFYAVCPFGPVRGDMQAGLVVRAVYAGAGAKRLPDVTDAILKFRRVEPVASNDDTDLAAIAAESGIPFTLGA